MYCPSLHELPPPPSGKTGWPWTEVLDKPLPPGATSDLASTYSWTDQSWPTISLTTPNFNQGDCLEEAIRSVLLQGYPKLEYFVIDGGSTDTSVEVIQKYEPWLTGWISETDRGQADAINKGFSRSTGDILNWLCGDDILLPGTLLKVGQAFLENPERDVVVGLCRYILFHQGGKIHVAQPNLVGIELLECCNCIPQPACFYRRALLKRVPPLDEAFNIALDHELWCYFKSQDARWWFVEEFWAEAHESGTNKSATSGRRTLEESEKVYTRYIREPIPLTFWYKWLRHPILMIRYRWANPWVQGLTWPLHVGLILILGAFYGINRVRAMGWPYTPPTQDSHFI